MIITQAEFQQFKFFSLGDIQKIKLGFPNPVTVVLGTNGSGKSCLLNELNPLPSPRTNFHAEGLKRLHIQHKNKSFILTSDYRNKNSPHSFVMEGEEYNLGGTTQVQAELAATHLGYTQELHDLIYLTTELCRMSKSERKNYFLQLCPTDFSLVLDIHKRSLSKTKEYKNNLTHLYKRKTEIQSKLLTPELLEDLKKHRKDLEDQSGTLDKLIYALHQHIQVLQDSKSTDQPLDLKTLQSTYLTWCKQAMRRLPHYSGVDRNLSIEDVTQLQILEATLQQQLQSHTTQANELNAKLSEYRAQAALHTDKPISKIEEEVTLLDGLIKDIIVDPDMATIPVTEEQVLTGLHTKLQPLVVRMADRNQQHPLWTNEQLRKVARKLDSFNSELRHQQHQVQQIQTELQDIEAEVTRLARLTPPDCNFDSCTLRSKFVSQQKDLDTKYLRLKAQRQSLEKSIARLEKARAILGDRYATQADYVELYRQITQIWHDCYLTAQINPPKSLYVILSTTPVWLLQYLEAIWTNSTQRHLQKEYQAKRDVLQQELMALIKANDTSAEFMQTLLDTTGGQLNQAVQEIKVVEKELEVCLAKQQLAKGFMNLKSLLETKYQSFQKDAQQLTIQKAIEYYNSIIRLGDTTLRTINRELRELDIAIREQDTLRARYTEEVLEQIAKIEASQGIYHGITSVLSPNSGLPHRYLVKFINGLIHNVNYFINQVFSYPLKITPLDVNSDLDFQFPMTANGHVTKDISFGSKGQKEVINLAWSLAILLQKKYLNQYPIFLDEFGSSFDPTHQIALLELLKSLQNQKLINQLFMINHHAIYADGFNDSSIVCLYQEGIILPERTNEHVSLVSTE